MSLQGYNKKTKPALWVTMTKGELVEVDKPRKPIRAASKKRAVQLREYRKLKEQIMESKPRCAVCYYRPAIDLHHKSGKVGKLLCYEPEIIPICRKCHDKIHHEPAWAKVNGWLADAGRWNNQKIVE